jgi:CheY-like chemotaxis protein
MVLIILYLAFRVASMVGSKRILIVEDDEGIRETLRVMLEFENYPVSAASNGEEALRELEKIETPGLILLDLMMPVMNGWDFAKMLAQNNKWSNIPIVVLTAFAEKIELVPNARVFLKKPIEFDVLMKLVKDYCG